MITNEARDNAADLSIAVTYEMIIQQIREVEKQLAVLRLHESDKLYIKHLKNEVEYYRKKLNDEKIISQDWCERYHSVIKKIKDIQ